MNPRSHHKGATGRVRTGDQQLPVLCHAHLGQDIKDYCSRIVQVGYQGQTLNTRILERKLLIDTSYHIQHRLELKYFHFAQFLLNAHWATH